MGIQELCKWIEESLREACDRIPDQRNRIKTDKISANTKKLIQERERLRRNRFQSTRERIEFAEMDKLVKREIRNDIRKFNTKTIKEAIENHTTLRGAKRGLEAGRPWIPCLDKGNGEMTTDRREIMEVVT